MTDPAPDPAPVPGSPEPGRADLIALGLTFFALGVTTNVLVLDRVDSIGLTIGAALIVNSATSEFAYIAVVDAGGSQLAAIVAGWVVASRFGLFALSLGARLRAGTAHRAAAAVMSFDPNVTIAVQQADSRRVASVFWMVTGAMFAGWIPGTIVGAALGNVIGDADAIGLDALFPAALLAIIGNLLRRGDGAAAAAVGGGLCLVLIPVAPAGIPIIASLVGAAVALAVKEPAT